MYRPDEMAFLTEQMRQEIKENRLAYSEKKTITWDGNTEGKASISVGDDGRLLFKVSDTPIVITQDNIKKVMFNGNEKQTLSGDQVTVASQTFDNNATLTVVYLELQNDGDIKQYIVVADNDIYLEGTLLVEKGVYLWNNTGTASTVPSYVSCVELETIHPIPQEYIPPLDRLILNGADGNQYALTITDGAISVAPVTT